MAGVNLFFMAEILAIGPYILRSIRIRKVYEAREIYWKEDVLPKEMIRFWSERRLVMALTLFTVVIAAIYIPIEISDIVDLPSYNILSVITDDKGLFIPNQRDYENRENAL